MWDMSLPKVHHTTNKYESIKNITHHTRKVTTMPTMKLNCFLFMVGLMIPASSAVSSFANNEDHNNRSLEEIIIDSFTGDKVIHFQEIYSAEKEALLGNTRNLAQEDRPFYHIAASRREQEGTRLLQVEEVFPCDTSNTHNEKSKNHFYKYDLQAGVTYAFEVIRDTSQCALDPVAWLYRGDCDTSQNNLGGVCVEITKNDDAIDRCGPHGDPYIEITPATSGRYTLRIGNYASDACPVGGYKYHLNLLQVSAPEPCAGVNCGNAGKCQVTSPTTALCKCENTFVPSESGLKCICPDGLDFHANVNRCLPPPTAAPTNPPTKSPTVAPIASPTASPIIKTEEVLDCTDNKYGTFKLVNVKEEVECSWLTRNNDKTKIRKKKHCRRDEVKSLCPSTCGACTECDDKEGTFTLPNMKKRESCAWLTKNKLKTETRKSTYCADPDVSDMCKASCGACAFEDESGRV